MNEALSSTKIVFKIVYKYFAQMGKRENESKSLVKKARQLPLATQRRY